MALLRNEAHKQAALAVLRLCSDALDISYYAFDFDNEYDVYTNKPRTCCPACRCACVFSFFVFLSGR